MSGKSNSKVHLPIDAKTEYFKSGSALSHPKTAKHL